MIRRFGKLLPSVSASPLPAVSIAGECNTCDITGLAPTHNLSNSAFVSCNCKALEGYDAPLSLSVFKVYEDELNPLDDWEFAGDEENDNEEDVEASTETSRYLTGAIIVPNSLQLSLPLPAEASLSIDGDNSHNSSSLEVRTEVTGFLDEELGQSRACDWLEPPQPFGAVATHERQRQLGDEGVMLEAFQQFQHNPQIQKMVVALATDAGVWRAVLANKKLQEYRVGDAEGDFEACATLKERDFDSGAPPRSRVVSNFVLLSHNAMRELKEGLRDQVRGIIEVVDKRVQAETRQMMFDFMVRMFMIMAFFMLTLIAFLCLLPLQVSRST